MIRKIIFLLIICLAFISFQNVQGGSTDNVFGWAWVGGHQINENPTPGIGWLSFNNCSSSAECSGINYGVRISTSTGYFSGYIWSGGGYDTALATNTPVLGWISFNGDQTGNPPSNNPCTSYLECIAKLENGWETKLGKENVYIKGWARVLSATNTTISGGWDGWIRLDYATTAYSYEVYIDQDGYFHGWAWSDGPLGTISFNSAEGGGSNYWVRLELSDFNKPPQVDNLSSNIEYCNIFKKVARVQVNWRYNDPPPMSSTQKAYGLEVEQDEGGGSWRQKLKCDYILSSSEQSVFYIYSTTYNSLLNCQTNEIIEYGKKIRWRVRVFDQNNTPSDWSEWQIINDIAYHAYPWPSFTWTPQRPTVGQVVQFFDQSICFDNSMNETSCASWFWTFTNGNPYNSNQRNPTTTFSQMATSQITLFVADSSGQGCTTSTSLTTTYPLPRWKEIPPIIWLRKAIAAISQFRWFK